MFTEAGLKKQFGKLDSVISLNKRSVLLMIVDVVLINLAAYGALQLRFDFRVPQSFFNTYVSHAGFITIIMLTSYYMFNLYGSLWRYASINELTYVVVASILGSSILGISFTVFDVLLPRSFYLLFMMINILAIGGTRFTYRVFRRVKMVLIKDETIKRVLVIGGGVAGAMMIKEMQNNPQIHKKAVAVIDDDRSKHKRKIHGVPVLGTRQQILEIVEQKRVDEIIIAMPSASKLEIKAIVHECKFTKCKLRTLPGIYELIDGKVDIKKVRDVEIEDLLGREPVKVNLKEITGYLNNEVILVTGGGGSIGSELCRQIAGFNPKKLLILDIYENNAYDIQNELSRNYKDLDVEILIASIRDRKRLEQIFGKYQPSVVFHAAAHKHVPLMEANPTEAIKNNVFGTKNVADMADKYHAKRFVLISTDKAVNPTNIMGATKRVAEMIIQVMDLKSNTEYVAVRFGNVLGSNGSVIPLFKKQIAEGGPITVTHPDIVRYFMTIPESVQLVIQAGAIACGGEIFVLDMGEPVRIIDLAKDLIKLSGLEPDKDIEIKYTGLRPGEKLYEELLMADGVLQKTKYDKIFIEKSMTLDSEQLDRELTMLSNILGMEIRGLSELIEPIMRKLVPTYIRAS